MILGQIPISKPINQMILKIFKIQAHYQFLTIMSKSFTSSEYLECLPCEFSTNDSLIEYQFLKSVVPLAVDQTNHLSLAMDNGS